MTLIYDLCKIKYVCEGGDEIETDKFVKEDDPLNENQMDEKKVSVMIIQFSVIIH